MSPLQNWYKLVNEQPEIQTADKIELIEAADAAIKYLLLLLKKEKENNA